MKHTAKRFALVSGATFLGVVLVLVFSYIGNKSKGPLDSTLAILGGKITYVEHQWLLSQRKPIRSKKLKWFNKYRNNMYLLQNPDTIFMGVYDNNYRKSFDNIIKLDTVLHAPLPLIQVYTAWGDKENETFPMKYAQVIYDLGSLPLITWEPWLNDFDREAHGLAPVVNPNKHGMAAVAHGDYDFYIDEWARQVKVFAHPVFIRLAHEMNDPYRYPWGPQNNKPDEFIAAWKHVVNRFRLLNVYNVLWVWSPQPSHLQYKAYYPGDEYVDWIGVGALNYGEVASWSHWWSFKEIFGNYYDRLDAFRKPLMITEMGSLVVGGSREKWFKDAFTDLPKKYPDLKALLFFDNSSDNTTLNKSLDWSIINDSLSLKAIRKAIKTTWKQDKMNNRK